ncbi:threonine/serine dehydratase [Micromonospora mangrovi]|uniref:Threonine/serine dehydratase n=2 Tax=Micromonospora TaxID=1873 RepID=A0AAU7M9W1_9ACTN
MRLVTGDDITAAEKRLDGRVVRTPLLDAPVLGEALGLRVAVKAENLQHTGSFKARGATNALLARAEREGMPAGLVAFSAGNHAIAVAFVGRTFGLPTVVCMPPGAVPAKVAEVRRLGAEPVFTDDLLATARSLAAERGWHLLPPFDDPDVIAGQATVGRELLADGPVPAVVLVPVGGGGLISGIAAAVKEASPATRVVGVEPDGANAMSHALRTGTPTPPVRPVSVADGLAAPFAGRHTLAHVRALVDEVVEVPEAAILPAWSDLIHATKLLVEPAAAVSLAALRAGLVELPSGGRAVLVLSGGNVDPSRLATLR